VGHRGDLALGQERDAERLGVAELDDPWRSLGDLAVVELDDPWRSLVGAAAHQVRRSILQALADGAVLA